MVWSNKDHFGGEVGYMIFHLISVFVTGIAAVGVVMIVFRLFGRKPPKFVYPIVAGLAMFGFNIYNEYAWYPTVKSGLPENIKVVKEFPTQAFYSPWSMFIPRIERFAAIDMSSIKRNEAHSGLVLAETLLVAKGQEPLRTYQLFDCKKARLTDLDEQGNPLKNGWVELDGDDTMLLAACEAPKG